MIMSVFHLAGGVGDTQLTQNHGAILSSPCKASGIILGSENAVGKKKAGAFIWRYPQLNSKFMPREIKKAKEGRDLIMSGFTYSWWGGRHSPPSKPWGHTFLTL